MSPAPDAPQAAGTPAPDTSAPDTSASDTDAPVALQIVHGRPSAEDVAAVVAVLLGRGEAEGSRPAPRSRWAAPALREGQQPSRDGWRASALPR